MDVNICSKKCWKDVVSKVNEKKIVRRMERKQNKIR